MSELSSQAVETGQAQTAPADVGAVERAHRGWPRRRSIMWRFALLRRMLALADLAAGLLASIALLLVGEPVLFAWSFFFLPAWVVVAKLESLYDRDARALRHSTVDEAPHLVLWGVLGTALLCFFLAMTPAGQPDAASALVVGVVATISVFALRVSARWLWRRVTPPERVLIVGSDGDLYSIKRKLELFPDIHATVVGERDVLDRDLGSQWAWRGVADRLIVAPTSLEDSTVRPLLELARANRMMLTIVPPHGAAFGSSVRLEHLAELPLLDFKTDDLSRSTLFLKRALDLVVSGIALVLVMPLFIGIAIAIKIDSRGPVLFSQLRAGQGGRPFRMLKFRSMVSNAENLLPGILSLDALPEPVFKLQDDPRVTRVGRVLRRWSLDELPQLWNVVVGQMGLVGPRPEQIELVERYAPEHRFRLSVKPGITGPMQVNGRGELTFAERLAIERDYIENLSLGRDLGILGMTLSAVVRGNGAY